MAQLSPQQTEDQLVRVRQMIYPHAAVTTVINYPVRKLSSCACHFICTAYRNGINHLSYRLNSTECIMQLPHLALVARTHFVSGPGSSVVAVGSNYTQ